MACEVGAPPTWLRTLSEPVKSSYSSQKPLWSESSLTPCCIHCVSRPIAASPDGSCVLPVFLSFSGSGRVYVSEPIRVCQALPLILSVILSMMPSRRWVCSSRVSKLSLSDTIGLGGFG